MSRSKTLLMFSTPVIVDDLEGADELNRVLEKAITKQEKANAGVKLSNRGGWQSKRDFPQWAGDSARRLVEHAAGLATAHTQSAQGAAKWVIDSWANVSASGGFNMPHVHGGSYWSVVYYVSIGEGSGGQLVLHDPRMPALRMHAPGLRFRNAGGELRAEIQPKPGLMVLFPAWLSHSVEPWDGRGKRISVAMNIRAGQARS